MTLRSLEIFMTVVEEGKMNLAAKKLHITQPSISKAIFELESEYNVKLFDRLSKKLYLTEDGEKMVLYSKNILSQVKDLEKTMLNQNSIKTINIGATITIGRCLLVDIIHSFETKYSNIKTNVIIDNTSIIEEDILSGTIDIGIVEGTVYDNSLQILPIATDELVLVCSKYHEFYNRDSISLEELNNQDFVLREYGSGTRELFEDLIKKQKIDINIKWSSHCFDTIMQAVKLNQGLTVISNLIVEPTNDFKIIPIKNISLSRIFNIVYHKNKYISRELDLFIKETQLLKSTKNIIALQNK